MLINRIKPKYFENLINTNVPPEKPVLNPVLHGRNQLEYLICLIRFIIVNIHTPDLITHNFKYWKKRKPRKKILKISASFLFIIGTESKEIIVTFPFCTSQSVQIFFDTYD